MSSESEIEKKRKQNNLMEKFMEEYQLMKKENQELQEKLEKRERAHCIELELEKDKSKKLAVSNENINRTLRDMKAQLNSNQQKLNSKEMHCTELMQRIDSKNVNDARTKDRDSNIFLKFLGRKPVSSNSADMKLITILNHFENQRERLEGQLQASRKEIESQKSMLSETQKTSEVASQIAQGDVNRLRYLERQQLELTESMEELQDQNSTLQSQNKSLQNTLIRIEREHASLSQKHSELKDLYKQLRIDYQAQVHAQQEMYLNFQSAGIHQQNASGAFKNQQQQSERFDNNGLLLQQSDIEDDQQQVIRVKPQPFKQEERIAVSAGNRKGNPNNSDGLIAEVGLAKKSVILAELCQIFAVSRDEDLIDCARKTELVMQAVPRMEELLDTVQQIVRPQARNIEEVIIELKKWAADIKVIDSFLEFKDALCVALNIPVESSTDQDILASIEKIVRRASEIESFKVDQIKQANEFIRAFEVANNESVQDKVSMVMRQFNDIHKFIGMAKKLLGIVDGDEATPEAVLSYVLKLLETMKMDAYRDNDLILKIVKALKVDDPVGILPKIDALSRNLKIASLTTTPAPVNFNRKI